MPMPTLDTLPVGAFTTDPDGRITYFNDAAAAIWGVRPELGTTLWCGARRLLSPGGRAIPLPERPVAVALATGTILNGFEGIAERPDGSRVSYLTYPAILRDAAGAVTGTLNALIALDDQKEQALAKAHLAAIVSSSDDAIISKTVDGIITSWNDGATRIFGYLADEVVGGNITRIIPPELRAEETDILAKIRRGERVDHFDTVRITKDGRRINISLTVSPIRDGLGEIVGASKVARDITERKASDELQHRLFEELNHRVKNTLAIIQALASQSLNTAASPAAFVGSFNGRIQALARAHDVLVLGRMQGAELFQLVRDQVVPGTSDGDGSRIECSGPMLILDPRVAVQLALVLHELATNARKHGALSVPAGKLSIDWRLSADRRELDLIWAERGGPPVNAEAARGFGTTLIERSLKPSGGGATLNYDADGLRCVIRLPLAAADAPPPALVAEVAPPTDADDFRGQRILVIEDEPLIAMDIEARLSAIGATVLGPAGSVEDALAIIARDTFDMALVDANLGGHPVDEIATALSRNRTPFAFVTGYGRSFLPAGYRDAPMIAKPFDDATLKCVLQRLR